MKDHVSLKFLSRLSLLLLLSFVLTWNSPIPLPWPILFHFHFLPSPRTSTQPIHPSLWPHWDLPPFAFCSPPPSLILSSWFFFLFLLSHSSPRIPTLLLVNTYSSHSLLQFISLWNLEPQFEIIKFYEVWEKAHTGFKKKTSYFLI